MRLREISPERYAREVLPLTAPLWAGGRTFEEYAAATLEIAGSRYGRRHYRTIGLYDGANLTASFKRYERTLHEGSQARRGIGFGAVFTPPHYRGRGYASVMLAMALDAARTDGYDLAFLFSDIRPQFYAALGFRALRSRAFSLRAEVLAPQRLELTHLASDDWNGVRRCFDSCERRNAAGFVREPALWEWIRIRLRHARGHPSGDRTNLVVRRRRGGIVAYVLGLRAPDRDAYVLDEYGCADDAGAAMVPALLRAAAGDLRHITGWLPPAAARDLLPKGTTRKRTRAILMMAPLRSQAEPLVDLASRDTRGGFCWPTDHV